MKQNLVRVSLAAALLASILLTGVGALPSRADSAAVAVPLVNGDFSFPAVPVDKKWVNDAKADGWTYTVRAGTPGIQVEYWLPKRPPFLFWNDPDGTVQQTVDPAKHLVKRAGDVYTLSFTLGGQEAGTIHAVSAILVDGKPIASVKDDLAKPKGPEALPKTLTYTATANDAGKSVGVRFDLTRDPGQNVQATIKDVTLTVTPAAN